MATIHLHETTTATPEQSMALHTAATVPTRRLHSRRLAWTERAGIPARAGRILANDHGAWEMSR
jgi:hypothetical protein